MCEWRGNYICVPACVAAGDGDSNPLQHLRHILLRWHCVVGAVYPTPE